MVIATVKINGVRARTVDWKPITKGIVGAKVLFSYTDSLWDSLIKNVAFEGSKSVSILNAGEEVYLPPEVVADEGVQIRVGVCGVNADGTMIIPTLWADLGRVREAVPVDLGEEAAEPVLPIWAQLEAMIGDLGKLTTEEKTNLVAAVNELAQHSGGEADPEEVRRIVEEYLAENPAKDGKDGVSVTHVWNGTVLTVTSASGTSSADLKGEKGEKGDPGEQGAPGADGNDYVLTDADKTKIAELAAEMVEVPEGGTVEMKPLTFTGAVNATYDGSEAVNVEIPQGGGGLVDSGFELIDTIDFATDEMAQANAYKEYTLDGVSEIVLIWQNMTNSSTTNSNVSLYLDDSFTASIVAAKTGKSGSVLSGYTHLKVLENCGTMVALSQGALAATNYATGASCTNPYNLLPITQKINKLEIANPPTQYYAVGGTIAVYVR